MYQYTRLLFIALVLSHNAYAAAKKTTTAISIEQAILIDINAYRQKHFLPPLRMEAHIAKQAEHHSLEMAQHKTPFGHAHFLKRVKILRSEIKNAGAAAENVAFNYKDAHDVVKNWLLSPGHKKNIVGNYNLTGIGVARDKQGKIYFTQIFLKTGMTQPTHRRSAHYQHGISLPFVFKRIVN